MAVKRWRLALLAMFVSAAGGCKSGTYLLVHLDSAAPAVASSISVTLTADGHVGHAAFNAASAAGYTLPQTFYLQLDANHAGAATLDVAVTVEGGGMLEGSASVQIAANSTASVTVTVGAAAPDLGSVSDLGEAPDLTLPPCGSPTPDRCSSGCVNFQTDTEHCGSCGNLCSYPHAGSTCTQGNCAIGTCSAGYMHCTGGPTNGCETLVLGTDVNNCGGCNMACLVGQICDFGVCEENQVTCASPGIKCEQPGCYQPGRYSISAGGGVVVDLNNNRQLWTRATRGPSLEMAASDDCMTLAIEGINGWRLPTYTELYTIIFMAGGIQGCPTCDPAIDQAAFNDTPTDTGSSYYLTSTYDMAAGGYDTVFFCDGRNNYPTSSPTVYRCIHAPLN